MPDQDDSEVPSEVLRAVADEAGGQVALVIGAGCSVEPPTSLPLSDELARRAYEQLVADNVLGADEDVNSEDLSELADLVYEREGSQEPLVRRLRPTRFVNAAPNMGHRMAAALLLEGAVGDVLTLNFDLAMSTALANFGAGDEVATVSGPDQSHRLSQCNLVYLHRNANDHPDNWILRSRQLEDEWQDDWEEVLATRVLTVPVVVFVGLGSPAKVLTETVKRIARVLSGQVSVVLVDPGSGSGFREALEDIDFVHVRMGWGSFAKVLAERHAVEQRLILLEACHGVREVEGWDEDEVDAARTYADGLTLLGLGELRAAVALENSLGYMPARQFYPGWLAPLLLTVAFVADSTESQASLESDGVVELARDGRRWCTLLIVTGRGERSWTALEADVDRVAKSTRFRRATPSVILASGVGPRPDRVAPPEDVIVGDADEDLLNVGTDFKMFGIEEIRNDPSMLEDVA